MGSKGFAINMAAPRKALLKRAERAFAKANEDLEEAIVGEIISPVWDWEGETTRRNGQVVSSPRNIVDERGLLDGYHVEKQGPKQTAHVFDAPYTLAVHDGAQLKNGGVIQPRPFTERPVAAFPVMFARAFRDDGSR